MSLNENLHCCLYSLFLLHDYEYIATLHRLEELIHPNQYVDLSQHHVTNTPYLHYHHKSFQLQAKYGSHDYSSNNNRMGNRT